MPTSRGIVQTTRLLTVCLIAALVCPAFGEFAGLTSPASCSSAHACCRRGATRVACPHRTPAAAHDTKCHGSVCVIGCRDQRNEAVAPVVLIGFFSAVSKTDPGLVATPLAAISQGVAPSFITLPLTPPPRTLTAT